MQDLFSPLKFSGWDKSPPESSSFCLCLLTDVRCFIQPTALIFKCLKFSEINPALCKRPLTPRAGSAVEPGKRGRTEQPGPAIWETLQGGPQSPASDSWNQATHCTPASTKLTQFLSKGRIFKCLFSSH